VVQVRYAGSNGLSVLGGLKTDKDLIADILQETWESADDWFSAE
jgi:DNA-damage-inducible protein I